jgi:hypothetical protein
MLWAGDETVSSRVLTPSRLVCDSSLNWIKIGFFDNGSSTQAAQDYKIESTYNGDGELAVRQQRQQPTIYHML